MPPVAAAVGAVASSIAGAGSAIIGAGTSALGGIATAGTGAITGLAKLSEPVGKIATMGTEIGQAIRIFERPDQQTSASQPAKKQPAQAGIVPTNILSTLPQILQKPQQQILTTPAITKETGTNFIKYLPIIGIALIGYLLLRR